MKIRVEDGQGHGVGSVEIPDDKVGIGLVAILHKDRMINIQIKKSDVWGWVTVLHWKQRARLERMGLLLP